MLLNLSQKIGIAKGHGADKQNKSMEFQSFQSLNLRIVDVNFKLSYLNTVT